jgi:hypothetical protein
MLDTNGFGGNADAEDDDEDGEEETFQDAEEPNGHI